MTARVTTPSNAPRAPWSGPNGPASVPKFTTGKASIPSKSSTKLGRPCKVAVPKTGVSANPYAGREVTFVCIFTPTCVGGTTITYVNSRVDKVDNETKLLLLELTGPLIVDRLAAGTLPEFSPSERLLLLAFITKLGILTTEPLFDESIFHLYKNNWSLAQRPMGSMLSGIICNVWLVDGRRLVDPTYEEITWVKNYEKLQASMSEDFQMIAPRNSQDIVNKPNEVGKTEEPPIKIVKRKKAKNVVKDSVVQMPVDEMFVDI